MDRVFAKLWVFVSVASLPLFMLFPKPAPAQVISLDRLNALANASRMVSPENRRAAISISSLENNFITRGKNDTLRISWLQKEKKCRIRFATRPGGADPKNYQDGFPEVGQGSLEITRFGQLNVGIYYSILQDVDSPEETSIEFLVFVQPPVPVRMLEPIGKVSVGQSPPVFRWEAVDGVPYYYIIVSQGDLQIETDPQTGEIDKLIGVNIIWQAFTDQPSIRFGEIDQAGIWPLENTPPLIPGETYHWLVFSAFAPGLQWVAWNLFPLSSPQFQVIRPSLADSPALIEPKEEEVVSDDEIIFKWHKVSQARRYRIVLRENYTSENYGKGTILLWQQVTLDTSARFYARDFLSQDDYNVQVIAEAPTAISASENRAFHYRAIRGVLNVWSRTLADFVRLPFADVTLQHKKGTGSPFPFFTDEFGFLSLDLPSGEYTLHASARGFLPANVEASVPFADTTAAVLYFKQAPFLVNGRVLSQEGQPVPFAIVSGNHEASSFQKVDGLGNFSLSTSLPFTSLHVSAIGYRSATISSLPDAKNGVIDVGDVLLEKASGEVAGSLQDISGMPVSGVRFTLTNPYDSFARLQTSGGRYQFRLEEGPWTIRPFLPGYYSQPEKYELNLSTGESRQAPFLFFAAALLTGQVFAKGGLVGGAKMELWAKDSSRTYQTKTDHFGTFRFDAKAGDYWLKVTYPGFAPFQTPVEMVAGRVTDLPVQLVAQKTVWGKVQNGDTGEPLANAEIVDVDQGKVLARTNESGQYSFFIESGRTVQLDARLPGFLSNGVQTVVATPGDSFRVDFQLEPASAVIQGKVTRNQTPVPFAKVRVSGKNMTILADRDGKFSLTLQPGTYQLQASFQCFNSAPQNVSVQLGEVASVELKISGTGVAVSGHVYDQRGQPLNDATILASGSTTVTSRSDSTGQYQLCLESGPYFILVSRIGYTTADTTIIVTQNDSLVNIDFFLEDNFAEIDGRTETKDGVPVPDVQIILSNFWQQIITRSDPNGDFQIQGIYPGESSLITRSKTYFAPPITLILAGREKKKVSIVMSRSDGFISGRIVDGFSGKGIDSALVVAQIKGNSSFFSAFSQAPEGQYRINNIPVIAGQAFRLLASKAGYTLQAPRDSVQANSKQVDLILLQNNGSISGMVISADTRQPVQNATVKLLRPGDPVRQAKTARDGSFVIPGLVFTFQYQVVVEHPFFFSDTAMVEAPAGGLVFALERKMAYVRGKVIKSENNAGFPSARIIFNKMSGAARSDTVMTDQQGNFFDAIWPGDYQVLVQVPLYFANPLQKFLTLAPGDTSEFMTFTLQRQAVKSLSIQGPGQIINNGQPVQYRAEAIDSSGRTINELPSLEWWVDVGIDTAQILENGQLLLTAGFAGSLLLGVKETESGIGDTLRVRVSVQIDSASSIVLFGRTGLELEITPGTVASTTEILFKTSPLTPVQKYEESFRVRPPLYRILPENLSFQKPVKLSLPSAGLAKGIQLGILRWDNLLSAWEPTGPEIRGEASQGMLSRFIRQSGRYAIIEFSRPLSIQDLVLRPNPFSPGQLNEFGESGVAIRFSITSDQAALPLITAKIYNLQGNLVAILANQKPTPKGPQHLSWNGLTIDGRRVRNGRYVLRFSAEDGKNAVDILKSIVLIE